MNRLKKQYRQEVVEKLLDEFDLNSSFAAPKFEKIVLNMGVSDPENISKREEVLEKIADQFAVITGQQAQITRAHKAVSNFDLRAGDPIGVKVTLRGDRMWQFLDKLISIALPRVKDFRGTSRDAFDGHGNYSLGLEEQIVFPEINYDQIDQVRGFQVNIVTSTEHDEQARRMLELLGFPFEKEEEKK